MTEDAVSRAATGPLEWAHQARDAALAYAPRLLGGVGILLAGWLLARVARGVLRRLFVAIRLDSVLEGTRVSAIVGALGKDYGASKLAAQIVYYALLLLTVNTAAAQLGLPGLQSALSSALSYLPKALSALALLAFGAYLAGAAKRSVGNVLRELRNPAAGLAETVTEAGILLIVALVTLDLLGVNLTFITANLTLLLGAALVVVVFLGCWAMRSPAEELIANYYLRRMLSVGDHVQTKTHQGVVLEFVPLGLILRDATGDEHFIPARELVSGLRRRPGLKPD